MLTTQIEYKELEIDYNSIVDKLNIEKGEQALYLRQIFEEVVLEITSICKPSYTYCCYPAKIISKNEITVGDCVFKTGPVITKLATGATSAFVFAATSGNEFETYLRSLKGEHIKEFFADAIGSEIPEAIIGFMLAKLFQGGKREGRYHSLSFSPGYCGWSVAEQKMLFSLLPEKPSGILLNESSLMTPLKSVTGFIFEGYEMFPDKYFCDNCKNLSCIISKK
jgi:hypothetical protein